MTAFSRALFISVAFLPTALPFAAWAADVIPADTEVDSVIVTARRDPEDPPVVADARQRLSETPGAVAVVSAESYASRYAPNLADSLRDVPGVFAQKKWGEDIRLSIRGSGLGNNSHNRGLLLAQDGVPFNDADGYGDFQLIDPQTARYTEVYKGGNALRFGGALLGGAVNLVTPTGRTAGAENLIRLEGGSFDTKRIHGEVARVWGDWDGFAAVTLLDAQGFRDHAAQSSARASINVGRQFGEDRSIRLYLSGGDVGQEIPGALSRDAALTTPRAALASTLPSALDSQRNMQSIRTALQTRWRLNPSTVFEGGVYASWKDLDHPIFEVIDQQGRNYGVFGRVDWEGEIAGRRVDAFYGAWYRTGDLDARQWVNLHSNRGALTQFSHQDSTAADVFTEGRLFLTDQVAVVGGATYGAATRSFVNVLNPARNAGRDFNWIAPRIGLLWQNEDGAQVYANVTKSVEPPNMSALAQNNSVFAQLEPQEAVTTEIGARGRRGPFTWDISAYRAKIDGELLTFVVAPNTPGATFNAKTTVHQGLEAALDWRITERLRLRQTYAWSDFRFTSDVNPGDQLDGNRLPVAPQHSYRAELKYTDPRGWFVAPSLEWSPSKPFVDYANSLTSPAYAVLSLNAGVEVGEGVRVFIDARNVTDETYIPNVNAVVDAHGLSSTTAFWPGDGRSVIVGLAAAF